MNKKVRNRKILSIFLAYIFLLYMAISASIKRGIKTENYISLALIIIAVIIVTVILYRRIASIQLEYQEAEEIRKQLNGER